MAKWDLNKNNKTKLEDTEAYRRGVAAGLDAALFLSYNYLNEEITKDLNDLAQKAKKGLPPV